MGETRSAEPPAPAVREATDSAVRLLLVEDDRKLAALTAEFLECHGM